METKEIQEIRNLTDQKRSPIHFPDGIPAFEHVKDFTIISNPEEAPFLWLQATNVADLAFITIDPFLIYPNYQPELCDEDVNTLKVKNENEVLMLSIVNLSKAPTNITTNLVSPIVINWEARLGKQVILKNHLDYKVKYNIENL